MTDDNLDDILEKAYVALESGELGRTRALLDRAKDLAAEDRDVVLLEVDLLLEEAEEDEDLEAALDVLEEAVGQAPDDPVLGATLASHLVELFNDHAEALHLLERVLDNVRSDAPEDHEEATEHRDFLVDALLLLSECRSAVRDPLGALEAAEEACDLDPDDAAARVSVATARFDLCDLDGARTATEEALELDPGVPEAHWIMGRLETLAGNDEAAEEAFARAASIDPDTFYAPFRVSEDELVAIAEEALASLPEEVRAHLKNIAIVVEDVPELDRLTDNEPPLSPGSLGLFEGTSPAHEVGGDQWSQFPRQIVLYRKNIEIESPDREELRDAVATTLVHEVGHYLGLDEQDLDDRGLG